jgi:hypothetical protein
LEELRTETLTRLKEIQTQINSNLEKVEQEPSKSFTPYSKKIKQSQQKVRNKEQ